MIADFAVALEKILLASVALAVPFLVFRVGKRAANMI